MQLVAMIKSQRAAVRIVLDLRMRVGVFVEGFRL